MIWNKISLNGGATGAHQSRFEIFHAFFARSPMVKDQILSVDEVSIYPIFHISITSTLQFILSIYKKFLLLHAVGGIG